MYIQTQCEGYRDIVHTTPSTISTATLSGSELPPAHRIVTANTPRLSGTLLLTEVVFPSNIVQDLHVYTYNGEAVIAH